jgi:hypothetical protein
MICSRIQEKRCNLQASMLFLLKPVAAFEEALPQLGDWENQKLKGKHLLLNLQSP